MDSIDLTWDLIKGENSLGTNKVMSDLKLPATIGEKSKITWSSSDESAITNDGKVTMGRVPKTVTMTATISYGKDQLVKKFTITVPRDPELPAYTGAISGSQTVQVGDEFKVTIKLDSENSTAFNAYRFTLSFNVGRLQFVGVSDPNATVNVESGRITISGIGAERPVTDTFTLTFKAIKNGVTDIKLVKVEMDLDPNASLESLPTMTVTEHAATIDIQKEDGGSNEENTEPNEKPGVTQKDGDSTNVWILVGLVAAILVAGGAIAVILIRKKKQTK